MQVNVFNDIPASFPSAANGISIHWHGFSMRGNEWYDGSAHIVQCPIQPGTNFTYNFQVIYRWPVKTLLHWGELVTCSCVRDTNVAPQMRTSCI